MSNHDAFGSGTRNDAFRSSDARAEDARAEDACADDVPWQPIDLLLNQGNREQVSAMRSEVARDPMRALDLADTVALVEQFRHLRTEPSPEFAGKLQDVALHADRFYRSHFQRKPSFWLPALVTAVAATATFSLLWWLDAAQLWQPRERTSIATADLHSFGASPIAMQADETALTSKPRNGSAIDLLQPEVVSEAALTPEQAAWQHAVSEILSRLDKESTGHLREAFRNGIVDHSDALTQWLNPSNALVMMRLEHELRSSAEARIEALRDGGALAAVDGRVQELANGIAEQLTELIARDQDAESVPELTASSEDLAAVAFGVRALIAAGSSAPRAKALRESGSWLARQAPKLRDHRLILALSGLMELATISGQHFEIVAAHGQRLVDEVLQPNDETWRRRLPELLSGRVAAGTLGEAGRIMARLPAFGVDPTRCRLVRQLLLGQLRDRRVAAQDRPEVLAAMLYGCNDLLDESTNESDRVGWQLLRWKPTRLAPDFKTVQQIAWSRTPGSRGYTRLQRELRQLAVLPRPQDLASQGAFCMCLATNFAAYAGSLAPVDESAR